MQVPMIFFTKPKFQVQIYAFLFFASLMMMIFVGFGLKAKFVNGDCCDMTYSRYSFIPIGMTRNDNDGFDFESQFNENNPKRYRLLKFVDARDPRMKSTFRNLSNAKNKENTRKSDDRETGTWPLDEFSSWCKKKSKNNPGHVVLFVPGHWGNYDQARSLGAHGLRLTGRSMSSLVEHEIIKSIRNQNTNASSTGDQFLYDVYTIDFRGGEGSAFHASTLFDQANFVRLALGILKVSGLIPCSKISFVSLSTL